MNKLFYGDCLTVMQEYMKSSSVDLIYLDPPFNSNRAYNAIYKDETGRPLPDQIDAFCDLWTLDEERERAIRTMPVLMREAGIEDSVADFWRLWMNALRETQPRLLAYLSYMVERLIHMQNILKPTGSIYLHCDSTASHYIKAMMDAIFGHKNFRNEIIWKRYAVHSLTQYGFDAVSDTILFYSASQVRGKFSSVYGFSSESELNNRFPHIEEDTGRRFQHVALEQSSNQSSAGEIRTIQGREVVSKLGWRWSQKTFNTRLDDNPKLIYWTKNGRPRYKKYVDEYKGAPLGNIWTDIPYLSSGDKERLGYATQKPLALLDRIIKASSSEGDVVFDPFCGCATTLESAERLGRRWIGIDIAIHAVKRVTAVRLRDKLGLIEGQDYAIEGVPRNLEGAKDLWDRDKYHFQKWAVEEVDGFVTTKRTADGGVDGRIYFGVPDERDLQSLAIEVKGGANVNISDLRALAGVLENDLAMMAGLIVMEPLGAIQTRNFHRLMGQSGDVTINGVDYPKLQMLTVPEILEGKRFQTPGAVGRGLKQPSIPGV